jgi:hypothetical protein
LSCAHIDFDNFDAWHEFKWFNQCGGKRRKWIELDLFVCTTVAAPSPPPALTQPPLDQQEPPPPPQLPPTAVVAPPIAGALAVPLPLKWCMHYEADSAPEGGTATKVDGVFREKVPTLVAAVSFFIFFVERALALSCS